MYNGVTVIQLNHAYNNFEIPVYDGLGQRTNDVISVTEGSTEGLIPKGKTQALSGDYILVYKKDSGNTMESSYIYDKAGLWNAISNVAAAYSEFDERKAALIKDVRYSVSEAAYDDSGSYGLFNSLSLLNGENTDAKQYFDSHSAAGDNIWQVTAERVGNNYVVFTDDVKTTIAEVLNTIDTDSIILRNMANIAVTPNIPNGVGSVIDYQTGDGIIYDYPVNKYPVATDNIAAYLSDKANPNAGYKYDIDNWTLWGINAVSGGVMTKCNIPVTDNSNGIGIDQYKNMSVQSATELLVSFPQTELKTAVEVTAPVAGNVPATTATVPDNDGYSVVSVSWSDGNTELTANETFEEGKQYTVNVTLQPDTGLQFISTTPATINTNDARAVLNSTDGTLTVSYTFDTIQPEEISSVQFTVTSPAIGKTPDTTVTLPDNANYTVSDVSWSPDDETFKSGTQYTITATVTARDGFGFTDNTAVKINSRTATAKTLNQDGTLTVSYTFNRLSSGGSGGGGYHHDTERKPAKTDRSKGWDKITSEIKSAPSGSTIEITLNDDTYIPEDALKAAVDNKVKLVMDAGFGRTWTIDGAKAVSGDHIDLTISGVNVGIPAEAYQYILFSDSRQLRVNARQLNFTAQLTVQIDKDNVGQNAALYLYNEKTGKLVFQSLSVVDKDGSVTFDVTGGGRYFIALGSEVKAPSALCGDVNGDGVVNAFDAAAILIGVISGSVTGRFFADFNSDGVVNELDAAMLLKYVVGIVKELPASAT